MRTARKARQNEEGYQLGQKEKKSIYEVLLREANCKLIIK